MKKSCVIGITILLNMNFAIQANAEDLCYETGNLTIQPGVPEVFPLQNFKLDVSSGKLAHVAPNNRIIREWGTHRMDNAYAIFQSDGNFVVYSPTSWVGWNSATEGNKNALLCLEESGQAKLYQDSSKSNVLWSTSTPIDGHEAICFREDPKPVLEAGEEFHFANGYRLRLEENGELVQIYQNGNKVTSYSNGDADSLVFKDGRLSFYKAGGEEFLSHISHSNLGDKLCFLDNATYGVYDSNGSDAWSSRTHVGGSSSGVFNQTGSDIEVVWKWEIWGKPYTVTRIIRVAPGGSGEHEFDDSGLVSDKKLFIDDVEYARQQDWMQYWCGNGVLQKTPCQ